MEEEINQLKNEFYSIKRKRLYTIQWGAEISPQEDLLGTFYWKTTRFSGEIMDKRIISFFVLKYVPEKEVRE